MNKLIFVIIAWIFVVPAGGAQGQPFKVSIVPEHRSNDLAAISWGNDTSKTFYVVVTNISDKAQPIFETSNSWGYRAISFSLVLPDGTVSKVQPKQRIFTVNFPSVYVIPSGGHQVFPIKLDDSWEGKSAAFGSSGQTKVKITAVYSISSTPESKEKGVWEGKIESAQGEIAVHHK